MVGYIVKIIADLMKLTKTHNKNLRFFKQPFFDFEFC